jgi:hypothetical protein
MKDAMKSAPTICIDCGKKLDKPRYGFPWTDAKLTAKFGFDWVDKKAPIKEKVWHIHCKNCCTSYVWSYCKETNGCWKIRSFYPLWDTAEIIPNPNKKGKTNAN